MPTASGPSRSLRRRFSGGNPHCHRVRMNLMWAERVAEVCEEVQLKGTLISGSGVHRGDPLSPALFEHLRWRSSTIFSGCRVTVLLHADVFFLGQCSTVNWESRRGGDSPAWPRRAVLPQTGCLKPAKKPSGGRDAEYQSRTREQITGDTCCPNARQHHGARGATKPLCRTSPAQGRGGYSTAPLRHTWTHPEKRFPRRPDGRRVAQPASFVWPASGDRGQVLGAGVCARGGGGFCGSEWNVCPSAPDCRLWAPSSP